MRSETNRGRYRGLKVTAAAALLLPPLLLSAGCGTAPEDVEQGTGRQMQVPSVPSPQVSSLPAPDNPPSPGPSAQGPAPMAESAPASLSIPSIGAQSKVIRLGLDTDGALEVPPGEPGSPAGWYEHSPTPGELGPAVFLGHVNAEGGGPGIFADLRRLTSGDWIEIAREDGSVAVFAVQAAEQYAKDAFPTQKVYGNTKGPELRLITCDGFDPKTGTFDDNYVVYASLVPQVPSPSAGL